MTLVVHQYNQSTVTHIRRDDPQTDLHWYAIPLELFQTKRVFDNFDNIRADRANTLKAIVHIGWLF